MLRNAAHLRAVVATPPSAGQRNTRILFRTSLPGYPTADLLPPDTPGGAPPVFTAPSQTVEWARSLAARGSSRYNHHMILRLNELARRAFGRAPPEEEAALAARRPARAGNGVRNGGDGDGDGSQADLGLMDVEVPMLPRIDGHLDYLHYCLPGPVDFYTEALSSYVLR